MAKETAFPYHEPPISIILNQAGLLLALNLINTCLDKLLYCGLIGQLFIGILWGTPGAKWLDHDMETVIQQLGYLGLLMLVYEGGLSISLPSLRKNAYLSLAVAFTGIGVPMVLSFVLMEMVSATPLEAFAAGAALSATSLGTTFTILSTTQLIATRLGTVTTSAAMLDDVVGLVMVQIITNLGGSGDSFSAVTVVRPLFVSIGFAVGLVVLCRFILGPILRILLNKKSQLPGFIGTSQCAVLGYTGLLVGMVAGAAYAGTSTLFAAYLAGTVTSWIDGLSHKLSTQTARNGAPEQHQKITGILLYECYYHGPVHRILIPMFFASIGFAIPITEMFRGSVVWRGFVYAILMTLGKLVTGLWLVRFSFGSIPSSLALSIRRWLSFTTFCIRPRAPVKGKENNERGPANDGAAKEGVKSASPPPESSDTNNRAETAIEQLRHDAPDHTPPLPSKPKSLYPASILGLAMVARGEVGYLIASLAESRGIFGQASDGASETYLIVIWAISLCTLIGPITVGMLVKRVKSLQENRGNSGGADPLGVWGI